MPSRSVRRLLATLAAAAVATLGLAAPAHAAAPVLTMAGTVVGQGATAKIFAKIDADAGTYVNPTMTFEASGLAAGVKVSGSPNFAPIQCTNTSATTVTCTGVSLRIGTNTVVLEVAADQNAKAGPGGAVRATFTADGVAPVTAGTTFEVAEGIGLKGGTQPEVTLHPGDRFDVHLAITNTSGSTVHGLVLAAEPEVVNSFDSAVTFPERFSNCTYSDTPPYTSGLVLCHFDIDLKPGATVKADMPAQVLADAGDDGATFRTVVSWLWLTAGTVKYDKSLQLRETTPETHPGTGPVLELTPAAAPVTEGAVKQFGRSFQGVRVHVIQPSVSAGPSASGGPTLPITGPRTGLLAGGGALVVALGLLGLMLARRRRTRFEA
ncbi:hypothetical protein [Actinoplanes sp. L3-i22]|uniref:hypothetical protein n=1 Tax=Actinoplanes sp. L3-i22 TaxID=2836373 RepID=UPI001C75AF3F|nr:hypothetical protein [Actinoplanes sp. L3-i22]BCY11477.1 hypothetical protein L3i22_065650 [Actinoplanes sp. L3-i22]